MIHTAQLAGMVRHMALSNLLLGLSQQAGAKCVVHRWSSATTFVYLVGKCAELCSLL